MIHRLTLFRLLVLSLMPALLFASAGRPFTGPALAAQSVRRELPLENRPQAYGVYLAIVTSRPDPHMRVQVQVPALNISGEWARACVPVGSTATPLTQSRVWVMFEGGDTRQPVWIGVPGN